MTRPSLLLLGKRGALSKIIEKNFSDSGGTIVVKPNDNLNYLISFGFDKKINNLDLNQDTKVLIVLQHKQKNSNSYKQAKSYLNKHKNSRILLVGKDLLPQTFAKRILNSAFSFSDKKEEYISPPQSGSKNQKTTRPKIKRKFIITTAILALLLPLLFTGIGGGALYISFKYLKTGNVEKSLQFSKLSHHPVVLTNNLLRPIGGPIGSFSNIMLGAQNSLESALTAISASKNIFSFVVSDDTQDFSRLISQTQSSLDSTIKHLSFLESDIKSFYFFPFKDDLYLNKLQETKNHLKIAKNILSQLPEALGQLTQKRYLVLLQNNMELRPTGGFIGSFALVSFNKGKLLDTKIYDVYTADGQLKGHVEPPAPIKNYLGEANWYLRDSNWSPDFPTSAKRAEWFLEKELGIVVDGVVGVDLETTRDLVEVVGGIAIKDFGIDVDKDNLYEVIQFEAEKDFFPGSTRKRNVLTALERELIAKLTNSNDTQLVNAGKKIFNGLNNRHVQVYLHNPKFQKLITDNNWDGGQSAKSCTSNCFNDLVSVVEANVGVNKANKNIKRSTSVLIEIKPKRITKTLVLNLKNNNTLDKYKSYIRVFAPKESNFLGNVETVISGEFKEAGTLIEIAAGQSKNVTFSWSTPVDLDFSTKGEYNLTWRKQAGLSNDPILIQYLPPNIPFSAKPRLTLTQNGRFEYNTVLARDEHSRIFW